MNLAVVNEAVTGMNGVEHEFTEEEKNFVVQFAFRSGSKEDTISLIEALAHSTDKVQSEEIMVTYRSKYDIKPAWVEQVENLLVALEMYRIEEEKAISHLSDILTAYGIDVSAEEIRSTKAEEIRTKVKDLKRLGRGFRNFEHFRNRFLYATRSAPVLNGVSDYNSVTYFEEDEF